jgi:cytochrome oxidase assembly protein ShyY1
VSYRFALRPLWVLSHLFAVAVIATFVVLGFWQLDRHDQRADRNAEVASRAELPVVPVQEALGEVADPGELRFRTLSAEGTFGDEVVLVDNRSLDGLPGAWILAPFELADGSTLVVNRGFQFNEGGRVDPPSPPSGQVRLEGTVATWEDRSCGARTDGDGSARMACLRRDAASEAFGADVLPFVVQRQVSDPAEAEILRPVPAPELDSGPHRSYAVQWFTFATIVAIVYPLILRRVAWGDGSP